MGHIIFVTGGARSGKSTFAEQKALSVQNPITYIATLNIFDEEMKNRVEEHKKRRDHRFFTVEAYKNFDEIFRTFPENNTVLFDCIGNMVTNLMFDTHTDWDNTDSSEISRIENDINKEIEILIHNLKKHKGTSVIVSNELGMGLVPAYPLGRYFRDIAGRVNQKLASCAHEAYFIVSGIPMKIK